MNAKQISALAIDLSIVFSLCLILQIILREIVYVDTINMYINIYILYSTICYIIYGQTVGKYILRLKLYTYDNLSPSLLRICLRELLYKYFCLLFVGFLVFKVLENFFSFPMSIFLTFILELLLIWLVRILLKRFWWEFLSRTKLATIEVPINRIKYGFIFLQLFFLISFLVVTFDNNNYQNSDIKILGINCPEKFQKYPVNSKVKQYQAFLLKPHLSPKEYIFQLFEQYDIVILCEAIHRESTQWDLISDIVCDKRFINHIGNVFTEYGSFSQQAKLNSFLNTKFKTETILEKEASCLMLFMGSGFYNFLIRLNKLNNNLPDSLKVHEYFSDIDGNFDFFPANISREIEIGRDSIMAYHIIQRIKEIQKYENRKKCLIITNQRHAFGPMTINGKETKFSKSNEAHFIFLTFPGKTANVMINSLAYNRFYLRYPIHYGAWDRAFAEINNKPMGFNFYGNPFGDAIFDYYPLRKNIIKYKDVFTGFIFNKPIEEWHFTAYYPFREYGAGQNSLEIIGGKGINSTKFMNVVEEFGFHKFKDEYEPRIIEALYNIVPFILYYIILLIGILMSTFSFYELKFRHI